MNEHDENLRKARLYLTLDEDEMANVRAEHEKYERRKAAMGRGDMGSPVLRTVYDGTDASPLTFAPVQCRTCGIKLTTQSHAGALTCTACCDRRARLSFYAQQQSTFTAKADALKDAKARSARNWLMLWCAVAGVVAVGGAWRVGAFLFWLGGLFA